MIEILSWVLIALAALGVASTLYLWWVYWQRSNHSTLFRDWAILATMVTTAMGLTMVPALAVVFDNPRIPGAILYVVGALVLSSLVPVYMAVRVFKIRRPPKSR